MNDIKVRELHTERLTLKVPTMKEQHRLWEILTNEDVNKWYFPTPDSFFRKYNLDSSKKEDLVKARKLFMERFCDWSIQKPFYEKKIESINNGDNSNKFTWSIFLNDDIDRVIGQITCQPSKEHLTNPLIRDCGWYLDPDEKYRRKGYGKEAAAAVMDYMFNEVGITDIYTSAATINPASWKLMESLGFEYIGNSEHAYAYEVLETRKYHGNKQLFLNRNNK